MVWFLDNIIFRRVRNTDNQLSTATKLIPIKSQMQSYKQVIFCTIWMQNTPSVSELIHTM